MERIYDAMLFRAPKLDPIEIDVVGKIQESRDLLRHAADPGFHVRYKLLERSALARAIRASNSIEGLDITLDDAIAVVAGGEPLALDPDDPSFMAFGGNLEAMTYVLRLAHDPHFRYSVDLLRSLHFMMMKHEVNRHPGSWRPGWIAVHDAERDEIVYEGPDAEQVPALMEELVAGLNEESDDVPLVRAAMAHLNLVMIHPFSDGNGRMARCFQTLVLARSVGVLHPSFASIEEHLRRNRRRYYEVLGEVGQGAWRPQNDTRRWVRFCLRAHYFQAQTWIRRARQLERLWDALDKVVDVHGLPRRAKIALSDAAHGLRVRNATYREAADISRQVATKDLLRMSGGELLIPEGEKRGRYYLASDAILGLFEESRLPKRIEDPFKR